MIPMVELQTLFVRVLTTSLESHALSLHLSGIINLALLSAVAQKSNADLLLWMQKVFLPREL